MGHNSVNASYQKDLSTTLVLSAKTNKSFYFLHINTVSVNVSRLLSSEC